MAACYWKADADDGGKGNERKFGLRETHAVETSLPRIAVALITAVAEEKALAVIGAASGGLRQSGRGQEKNQQSGLHMFV